MRNLLFVSLLLTSHFAQSQADVLEPTFDSAWFIPNNINNGDSVSLFVKTYDDVSGIQSIGAYIQSPSGTAQNIGGLFIQISDSVFKRTFQISPWAESGTWFLKSIAVWDSAGNDFQGQYMDCGASPATFNVNQASSCTPTGTNLETIAQKEMVFPNPFRNEIYFHKSAEDEVLIFNHVGQFISSTYKQSFDLSKYQSGIYFVKVKTHYFKLLKL